MSLTISKTTLRRYILGRQGLWPGRRWGYYTLPILYGDRLVARLDPKLDRASGTLVVNGFWLEESATGKAAAFAEMYSQTITCHVSRFTHTATPPAHPPARLVAPGRRPPAPPRR
ncbi:MAG TPA: hypothetical protein VJG32_07525 [Anaerolineae bacterium]|nr:hypothetical protein [Anaerolineae bacterium]